MDGVLETDTLLARSLPSRRLAPGSRSGAKAVLAKALLEQGSTTRNAAKLSGLSIQTTHEIRHRDDIVPSSHVEAVKKLLRDKAALVANDALDSITPSKLKKAPARDLAYIAKQAIEMAGLQAPSIVEQFTYSISKYEASAEKPHE